MALTKALVELRALFTHFDVRNQGFFAHIGTALAQHWLVLGLSCCSHILSRSSMFQTLSDSFRLFQTLFRLSDVHRVWQFGTETLVFGTGQHLTGCLSAQDLKGVLVKRGTQLCENTCFFLVRC